MLCYILCSRLCCPALARGNLLPPIPTPLRQKGLVCRPSPTPPIRKRAFPPGSLDDRLAFPLYNSPCHNQPVRTPEHQVSTTTTHEEDEEEEEDDDRPTQRRSNRLLSSPLTIYPWTRLRLNRTWSIIPQLERETLRETVGAPASLRRVSRARVLIFEVQGRKTWTIDLLRTERQRSERRRLPEKYPSRKQRNILPPPRQTTTSLQILPSSPSLCGRPSIVRTS